MADQDQQVIVPRVKLGNQGLEVSMLGLGCTSLSSFYVASTSQDDRIVIVKHAIKKGITFFDTSNIFEATEILLGQAFKEFPREDFQVATKCGIASMDPEMTVKGTLEYVRQCCQESLKRLGLDFIDLYYLQRIDTSIPIEETMGEFKKLVEEGKIKYVGLSEASVDTIRRAHTVHPITAVQLEWSLWTREIEDEIVPLCRELGIGIVPYCPLGRGFFAGKAVLDSLPQDSLLATYPRYRGENLEKNKKIYGRLEDVSKKHGCTPSQLALSWLMHQEANVVPIPGTTRIKNLEANIGSIKLRLTSEDVNEISGCVPADEVAGQRTLDKFLHNSWKFADTPPKC
ncbi:LOW QUALITY PROTEIN: uncharacterized protein [Phyllobates terribilis]|uniref:LOW QUALITY PROTEIN: uncharacterized protein n=1 Tax=Phyllobates terribilis TaxID=111132 RepID=UPI003CCB6586